MCESVDTQGKSRGDLGVKNQSVSSGNRKKETINKHLE